MPAHRWPGAEFFADPIAHLGQVPERLRRAWGERPALLTVGQLGLEVWTYADLAERSAALALHLSAEGIGPGDRVLLCGDNGPEWLAAFWAIARCGGVAVLVDPQYAAADISRAGTHCDVRGVIASDWILAQGLDLGAGVLKLDLARASFAPPGLKGPEVAIRSDDPAALFHTSGTGGDPHGVLLSHGGILSNAASAAQVLYVKDGDVTGLLLPLHHAYALVCAIMSLASGVPLAFARSLRPEAIRELLVSARVTVLPAVPLLVDHLATGIQEQIARQPPLPRFLARRLMAISGLVRDRLGARASRFLCRPILAKLGGLRGLIVGGAALRPEAVGYLHRLGISIANGYGLTEAGPVVSMTRRGWRPGDGVGQPLPGIEVRIDTSGVGEVQVRGASLMLGYDRDEAGTQETLRDGWLRTGDLGYFDSRGHLHLVGRSKNVIVLPSGKNVYPEELEGHYGHSPLLDELCVIKGQDSGGEFPLGIVVPSLEALAKASSDVELQALVAAELARLSVGVPDFKRLKRFEIRKEALPLTSSRKVRRHLVVAAVNQTGVE